ncbi:hypothetical protein EVAR_4615_1 [Eumeta japonica]|uniref:Uncharacterized protein n=1 Tax=Eumeta variegata TaxID=151549 RepID=A0A4C1SZQ2_EUMVA|nr:hypothetical protein EVAR_4615_1 [Eumeta japonica]
MPAPQQNGLRSIRAGRKKITPAHLPPFSIHYWATCQRAGEPPESLFIAVHGHLQSRNNYKCVAGLLANALVTPLGLRVSMSDSDNVYSNEKKKHGQGSYNIAGTYSIKCHGESIGSSEFKGVAFEPDGTGDSRLAVGVSTNEFF